MGMAQQSQGMAMRDRCVFGLSSNMGTHHHVAVIGAYAHHRDSSAESAL